MRSTLPTETIECPLCCGAGELTRAEILDRLGVRDFARVAQLSAEEAFRLLQSKHDREHQLSWSRFEAELAKRGAQRNDVLGLFVTMGLRLATVGVVVGMAVSLLLTRVIASFLFGVKPSDPLTYLTVAGALIIVALLASYIPARRATKLDPLVALRYE